MFNDTQIPELLSEIQTDPDGLGYAGTTDGTRDAAIADMLNTGSTAHRIDRESITSEELITAVASTDWSGLNASDQRWFLSITGVPLVKIGNANVRASLATIFGAGTQTRTNALTLQTRDGSRAEVVFGAGSRIHETHVAAALRR